MSIQVNKYQTQITEDLLKKLHPEVKDNLLEAITNIEFIKRLIDPNRKYAKDLPRDESGKIIVDIINPHILEDMEYFRPTGNYYRKNKKLTDLRPNGNPNSRFGKWFREEIRRCWEGMVRPEDGEWITGDMYFYLNYTPIIQTKIREGTIQGDRFVDFPEIWEGVYLWFHYLEQGRKGGIYNNFKGGNHGVEIAKRGASKSYSSAAILAKTFILGENEIANEDTVGVITAYDKEKLIKDGTLNKFTDIIDFNSDHTQFPSQKSKSSLGEMYWIMGYKDVDTGVKRGTGNEVIGVTAKDNVEKSRGKRSNKFIYEEFGAFKKFIDIWMVNKRSVEEGSIIFGQAIAIGCVCAGSKVWNNDGEMCNIEDLNKDKGILGFDNNKKEITKEDITYYQEPLEKESVRIDFHSGRSIECSTDHPLLVTRRNMMTRVGPRELNKRVPSNKFIEASKLDNSYFAVLPREIPITSTLEMEDARFIGWLIGDGSYGIDRTPMLSNADVEITDFVINNYNTVIEREFKTKDGRDYKEIRIKNITKRLRELGIYGQTKSLKRLPLNIHSYSKQSISELLGGLFDADGHISSKRALINISQNNKEILLEIQLLLQRLGIHGVIRFKKPNLNNSKDKNGHYELIIRDIQSINNFHSNIKLTAKYKQEAALFQLELIKNKIPKLRTNEVHDKIVKITPIGVKPIYNLTANNTHTYIVNGIATHNTGGSEGSDFSGALEIIYNPLGYNVYALPNVYDKNSMGKQFTVFFFGAYLNRKSIKNLYNKDGVSDVIGSLIEIFEDRLKIKYNSTDPMSLTRAIAEDPITIQEAIMKRDSTIYPVSDLANREQEISANPNILNDVYVGELKFSGEGLIFVPNSDLTPIRVFPHKDNHNMTGAIEIYSMPKTDRDGKVMNGRYIAGIDPYDDDHSNTTSLGSIFILDLYTDEIVAEYTGRPTYADDFYETVRRLLLFYDARANYENDKKGLYGYLSKHNNIYLLTDNLEFLKDKDDNIRNYGNKLKGTKALAPTKSYGRRIYRDYLISPVIESIEREDGTEEEISKPRTSTLKSLGLIKETAQWNPDGNFDRHDAMIMLMLLREDKLRLLGDRSPSEAQQNRASYLGNDSYFSNNFDFKNNKDSKFIIQ